MGEWTGTARDGLVDDVCAEVCADPIYLPSDVELIAARGAICSLIYSIANGNLEPRLDVMDQITLSVVRSLGWRPWEPGCDGKCARYECVCPPQSDESVLRSGGQTKQYGPRPHISTQRPLPQ